MAHPQARDLIRRLGRDIPAAGPALKAYSIGYSITVLPQVLKIALGLFLKRKGRPVARQAVLLQALRQLRTGLGDRFAIACAITIGGWKSLDDILYPKLAQWQVKAKGELGSAKEADKGDRQNGPYTYQMTPQRAQKIRALSTFLSSSMASYLAMSYLHTGRHKLGKTVEITLFFFVRALDALLRFIYSTSPRIQRSVPLWLVPHGDTLVFTVSCFEIMFSWFYSPKALPKAYVGWITKLARMDERLLEALRLARKGVWRYRIDDGNGHVVGRLAEEMGLPFKLGDPAQMDRLTCEIVHCGVARSCEGNVAKRWATAFMDSLKLYTPVHLIPPILFRPRHFFSSPYAVAKALLGAARSSAFLATFIASIWAAICLSRTRLGPRLLPSKGQIYWDDTRAVAIACAICGLSVSIENPRRRGEMALYVAPRALFSVFQRLGPRKVESAQPVIARLERILFASSVGVLITAQVERPDVVRGITKGVLGWIIGREGAQKQARIKQEAENVNGKMDGQGRTQGRL